MARKKLSEWEKAFTQGYYCAVASCIIGTGNSRIAKDLIEAMPFSIADLRRHGVDGYDLEISRPLVEEILAERRKNNRRLKSKTSTDDGWVLIDNRK